MAYISFDALVFRHFILSRLISATMATTYFHRGSAKSSRRYGDTTSPCAMKAAGARSKSWRNGTRRFPTSQETTLKVTRKMKARKMLLLPQPTAQQRRLLDQSIQPTSAWSPRCCLFRNSTEPQTSISTRNILLPSKITLFPHIDGTSVLVEPCLFHLRQWYILKSMPEIKSQRQAVPFVGDSAQLSWSGWCRLPYL